MREKRGVGREEAKGEVPVELKDWKVLLSYLTRFSTRNH
jgi:hypothetical protein